MSREEWESTTNRYILVFRKRCIVYRQWEHDDKESAQIALNWDELEEAARAYVLARCGDLEDTEEIPCLPEIAALAIWPPSELDTWPERLAVHEEATKAGIDYARAHPLLPPVNQSTFLARLGEAQQIGLQMATDRMATGVQTNIPHLYQESFARGFQNGCIIPWREQIEVEEKGL